MKKSNIILIFSILLLILLFLSPNIIDLIPNIKVTFVIGIIFCSIILVIMIFNTYRDIKNSKSKKKIYIVLTDLLMLLSMMSFILISCKVYKNYGITDIDTILYNHNLLIASKVSFFVALLLNIFLKKDISEKNQVE